MHRILAIIHPAAAGLLGGFILLACLLAAPASAQTQTIEVSTDKEAIPEGHHAFILLRAPSGIRQDVKINLKLHPPSAGGLLLGEEPFPSEASLVLSGAQPTSVVQLSVSDNTEPQNHSMTLTLMLTISGGNSPFRLSTETLSYLIPPNDLTARARKDAVQLIRSGQAKAPLFEIEEGLEGSKSFVVSSVNAGVTPIGIVTADKSPVVLDLLAAGSFDDDEDLEFNVAHLDAFKPSARPSAQLAAGSSHNCAIHHDNTVVCWGDNAQEQSDAPTDGTFLAVSSGRDHSCGIKIDGAAACWGDNNEDQRVVPQHLKQTKFLTISAGRLHSCAIRTDNVVQCWGTERRGFLGQVRFTVPDDLRQTRFIAVSAGVSSHVCGIRADNTMVCWGNLDRTGTDGVPDELKRVQFLSVSTGFRHNCGIAMDHRLRCWELNDDDAVPEELKQIQFLSVSVGSDHNCGIKMDGTAACWETMSAYPDAVTVPDKLKQAQFLALSVGDLHSCGIKTDGAAACWGSNQAVGQQVGPVDGRSSPTEGFQARVSPDTFWLYEKEDHALQSAAEFFDYRVGFETEEVTIAEGASTKVKIFVDLPQSDTVTADLINMQPEKIRLSTDRVVFHPDQSSAEIEIHAVEDFGRENVQRYPVEVRIIRQADQ